MTRAQLTFAAALAVMTLVITAFALYVASSPFWTRRGGGRRR